MQDLTNGACRHGGAEADYKRRQLQQTHPEIDDQRVTRFARSICDAQVTTLLSS